VGDYRKRVEPAIYYIPKEDMTQSDITMGHLGIRHDDPDYFALQLLNEVFSGGFASRLFSRIRSKEGLAYSVSGKVGSGWDHEGLFQMWMTTKVETTGAGIEALIREANNLTLEPPTEEEVERARESILNSFVFNSDAPSKTLGQQLVFEYHGYPLDWLDRYQEAIRITTAEDVRQAAKKHIHPDNFAIMVVGPSEGHDRPLTDFGPVSEIDISIAPPPGQ
jgi:zinc protease